MLKARLQHEQTAALFVISCVVSGLRRTVAQETALEKSLDEYTRKFNRK